MQGFGPVVTEPDEPVFHHDWERRVLGLVFGLMARGQFGSSGRFRHLIERMDPAWYLASPYYEHWLTAAATAVVEGGVVSAAELAARLGAPFPLSRSSRAEPPDPDGDAGDHHRYHLGQTVRVREIHPFGHTRCPDYIRGKRGVVVRLDGRFSVPDVEAHSDRRVSEPTYSVRFEADELWGDPGDPVHVDLWERYLEDV